MPARSLLAVYGSPRKGGNSSLLLDFFLEGFSGAGGPGGASGVGNPPGGGGTRGEPRDAGCLIEKVHLRELSLSPCSECGRCRKTGVCVVADDMSRYYEKLLSFDRLAMALPVFFLGPPAVAKAFIDRAQSLWVRKYALGVKPAQPVGGGERKGFLLSVGGFGGSDSIFNCNRSIVKAFYMSCGVKYAGELLVPGVDGFGELRNAEGVADRAREAGRNFAL